MNASVVRRRPHPPGPTSESARRDGMSEGDPGAKGDGARRRRRNAHGKPLGFDFGFGEGLSAGRSGLAAAAAAALFVLAASRLARGRAFFGGGIDARDGRRIGSLRGGPGERAAETLVLRISSSDHANVTQFFPCMGTVLGPNYVGIKDVLKPHRSRARFTPKRYDALPCAPALCFRGVYDGFDDLLTDDRRNAKIRLLMESLIRRPRVPLPESILRAAEGENRSSLIKESTSRRKTYRADRRARDFDELHADYFESPKYVYTAILYDDPSGDLRGGETALVDWVEDGSRGAGGMVFGLKNATSEASGGSANNEEESIFRLTHGTVVEPKRGRIVLFSSGGENFHAPLPVRRGQRPTHHVWFECEG